MKKVNMGEVNYVIDGLKKVDTSVTKTTFSKFSSWIKFKVGYRGVNGQFTLTYSQFMFSFNRAGGAVEYRVLPLKQVISYSITEIDSQKSQLVLWLRTGERIQLNFTGEDLKEIIKTFSSIYNNMSI
ncbi:MULTISPECIES: hypothetical protein [Myroides]|nr:MULTISPECIES: hypothetical protein [Myroides]MEC4007578.1 hypothetical protein [Myroides odoratimimus]MEC4052986.1 hypothetical protein [Myroides odoratimimus]WHT72185.1 hypothetical protein QK342_10700 [Myroides odoratimimus]WHU36767.1 hypothetical protein QNM93_10685 [Myroides odoratimimus]